VGPALLDGSNRGRQTSTTCATDATGLTINLGAQFSAPLIRPDIALSVRFALHWRHADPPPGCWTSYSQLTGDGVMPHKSHDHAWLRSAARIMFDQIPHKDGSSVLARPISIDHICFVYTLIPSTVFPFSCMNFFCDRCSAIS
jgi:hypothetical protein